MKKSTCKKVGEFQSDKCVLSASQLIYVTGGDVIRHGTEGNPKLSFFDRAIKQFSNR
jgi:hypothetical protein